MIGLVNADSRYIPLPDQSVQCVVTSPPYWNLRDYGTAQWLGGDEVCDHAPSDTPTRRGLASSTLGGGKATTGHQQEGYKAQCQRCGAVRIDKQIGLERTPQEYVASIVAVMREVWRVLKDDGVLWLNLGDSYARDPGKGEKFRNEKGHRWSGQNPNGMTGPKIPDGMKSKDLVGIPWRVAFALQDAGWYLRSDIIWSKPNPMPESVTDRPTKAHEYIFLLAKSERYYYDAESIKETALTDYSKIESWSNAPGYSGNPNVKGEKGHALPISGNGRNRRTVWTVATSPYSGAHFATFPPALVEPMIIAGSRPGDIVLDPFSGSGTVGRVSAKHGRCYVGLELNPAYIELAQERTSKVQTAFQL